MHGSGLEHVLKSQIYRTMASKAAVQPGRNRSPSRQILAQSRECHPEGALATEGSTSDVTQRTSQNLGGKHFVRVLPYLCFGLVGRFFGR